MHYKKGMPFQVPKDEMNKWQKSLQKIEINEHLKKIVKMTHPHRSAFQLNHSSVKHCNV